MGCGFCLTASRTRQEFEAHEIIDQIISVNSLSLPAESTNIVLMGMGEPLANFDEVVEALWRITGLMGISKRRITLSTSGIVRGCLSFTAKAPDVILPYVLECDDRGGASRIMVNSDRINRTYSI